MYNVTSDGIYSGYRARAHDAWSVQHQSAHGSLLYSTCKIQAYVLNQGSTATECDGHVQVAAAFPSREVDVGCIFGQHLLLPVIRFCGPSFGVVFVSNDYLKQRWVSPRPRSTAAMCICSRSSQFPDSAVRFVSVFLAADRGLSTIRCHEDKEEEYSENQGLGESGSRCTSPPWTSRERKVTAAWR